MVRSGVVGALLCVVGLGCGGGTVPPVEPIVQQQAPEAGDPDLLTPFLEVETLEELKAKYGDDVGTATLLENEVGDVDYPALYVDTPREIVFSFPTSIRIRQKGSPWKTHAGVHIGATLEELTQMNGGPFELSPSPEGVETRFAEEHALYGHFINLAVGEDRYPDMDEAIQSDSVDAKALGLTVVEFSVSPRD